MFGKMQTLAFSRRNGFRRPLQPGRESAILSTLGACPLTQPDETVPPKLKGVYRLWQEKVLVALTTLPASESDGA
jgi:hypothetical protein